MKKKILSFLAVFVLLAVLMAPASCLYVQAEEENQGEEEAEEKLDEAFFTTVEDGDILLISCEWDTTRPIVKFRSPSGRIYDTAEEIEGTHISVGDGMLYYQIDYPEAGDWYVLYDKLDNDYITIDPETVTTAFIVKDIVVSDITGTGATLSFYVDYDKYINIDYKISIVASSNGTGEVIYEGAGQTNEDIEVTVDLQRFGSSSEYRFYVYAYFDKDGGEIGEGAYSDKFTYVNPTIGDMQTPVTLLVEPDSFRVRINFERKYNYTYLVAFYADGSGEPSFFDEIEDNSVSVYDYVYNPDTKKLTVEISEKYRNNAYSNAKRFTIDIEKLPKLVFEDRELTNRRFVELHYSGFDIKTKLNISVNDDLGEYTLNAAEGDMTISIADTRNEVSISYDYGEAVKVLYRKEIYLDVEAPRIYMLQDYTDVTTTAQSISVSGTVTGASVFTIAGKEVALAADGTFIHTLQLEKGKNVFRAEAKDVAGNVSVYTIVVNSTAMAPSPTPVGGSGDETAQETDKDILATLLDFLPAIVAAVLGIALVVFVLVTGRKEKETTTLSNIRKIAIFAGVLGLIITGYAAYRFITCALFVNSTAYIDLAYESVEAAGKYLKQLNLWKLVTIAGAAEIAACVVSIIVVAIIGGVKKKKAA